MRGHAAECLATVTLARIREDTRRTEQELAATWDVTYASLFGALLDLAAAVAVRLPDVRLGESPRMADFARALAAVRGLPRRRPVLTELRNPRRWTHRVEGATLSIS